jgi:hypothetical protein
MSALPPPWSYLAKAGYPVDARAALEIAVPVFAGSSAFADDDEGETPREEVAAA